MMGLEAAVGAVSAALLATTTAAYHSGRRTTKNRQSDATPTSRDVAALEGVYPATQTGTSAVSLYEPGADTVAIEHDQDGYYDVEFRTADGAVVSRGHRPAYRIESALDGGPGYDYVARADPGSADGT
jgi:hypothetical protein